MSATVPGAPLALVLLIAAAGLACEADAQPRTGNGAAKPTATTRGDLSWASLTVSQQTALAPLKRDWATIDHARRSKWLELAARFPSMSDDEQQRIQARMTEWAQMSPEDRGRARLQFQETRNLSPEERKARWDAYMALPPEQRHALASRRAATAATPRSTPPAAGGAHDDAHSVGERTAGKTRPADGATPKAVSPTVIQPRPGATTTLISKPPSPTPPTTPATPARTAHPKVLAGESKRVNQNTLLPEPVPPAHAAPAGR